MPSKLAIVVLAASLAVPIIPAHAAGMPEIGTKNFIPGGDTPSYLTNENLTVAPGSPVEPAADPGIDRTAGPALSKGAPAHSMQIKTRHHGKLADGGKTAHRAAASAGTRATHVARTRTAAESKSASRGRSTRPVRAANTASPATTGTARHGKASVRHASAKSAARRG
jgi:hypothetical protein